MIDARFLRRASAGQAGPKADAARSAAHLDDALHEVLLAMSSLQLMICSITRGSTSVE